ncbi:hypothetical protein SAMN05661099_2029 [Daejeonella lutea]|uniref:Uncharacterized protein n=1 Tax=Daejeonella lutea TaxID=572036 RepID=A0A1T5CYK4_9SPHI|nr:hypothetical protein SAMN05661099_2029 [Daejeonella lutea]
MNLEKLFHMFWGLDDRKSTKILNLDGSKRARNQEPRIETPTKRNNAI